MIVDLSGLGGVLFGMRGVGGESEGVEQLGKCLVVESEG